MARKRSKSHGNGGSDKLNKLNRSDGKKFGQMTGNKTISSRAKQKDKANRGRGNALSALQTDMMKRLEGSRFRMLNEQLYTTSGEEAFQKFQDNPDLFDIYHQGFREQVTKWPINPLDTIIKDLKNYPKAVIADFGCGDARIAESLPNKVHSFDLIAQKPHVVACNMAHVPLDDGSIDIAVYCLALMGTTIREYLIETHRVLKLSGTLKIAEVKSRFETPQIGGISGFVKIMHQLGFAIKHKDESNKMFVLFDFRRTKHTPNTNATIHLKACEYKRR